MRTSRFLLGAAALAAVAVAGTQGQAVTASANDVNTLNYALYLERLEAGFYAQGQMTFSLQNFTQAGLTATDYAYFNLIAQHEQAHVNFLTMALGTNAQPNCTSYNYGLGNAYASVNSYIQKAATLEALGVTAYDGAINAISNPDVQQAAATIATIEARHSAYLNYLVNTTAAVNGQSNVGNIAGGQGGVDTANSPSAVANIAGSYAPSCAALLVLPQVRPGGVFTNSNLTNFQAANANPAPNTTYTQAQFDNDNNALNYALVLENLEAAFYQAGQAKFNRTAFQTYFSGLGANSQDGGVIYDNFALIAGHESAHAQFLTSVINGRVPGAAHPACTYDFTSLLTDIPTYVKSAITLESTGVSAYDGAVNAFTDTKLQQAGATIATIEARHTSYLNVVAQRSNILASANPFPGVGGMNNTDTPYTPSTVIATVTGLNVQTCSFNIVVPTVAPAPSSATGSSSSGSAGSSSAATGSSGASTSSGASASTAANASASLTPALGLMATLLAAAVAVFRM